MLVRDAFGMLAGKFTMTFSPPYVYVVCGARTTGPLALALGAAVVGGLVVVAEGLEPPVEAGSVALASDPPHAVRLAAKTAAQDRTAIVCFTVGFLPICSYPAVGGSGYQRALPATAYRLEGEAGEERVAVGQHPAGELAGVRVEDHVNVVVQCRVLDGLRDGLHDLLSLLVVRLYEVY